MQFERKIYMAQFFFFFKNYSGYDSFMLVIINLFCIIIFHVTIEYENI